LGVSFDAGMLFSVSDKRRHRHAASTSLSPPRRAEPASTSSIEHTPCSRPPGLI